MDVLRFTLGIESVDTHNPPWLDTALLLPQYLAEGVPQVAVVLLRHEHLIPAFVKLQDQGFVH